MKYYDNLRINGVDYPLAVNIKGSGAPTTATEADVSMLYFDEDAERLYICVSNTDGIHEWRVLLSAATEAEISGKSNTYKPIVPATLDYAVIQALTNNKRSLAHREQEAISVWLGVDERHVSKSVDGETGEETLYLGDVQLSGTQITDLLEMLENMGDIESALDTIISEQETIIEIQNALIGGVSE